MSIPKEAIEKAIEGWWKPENYRSVLVLNPNNRVGPHIATRASYTDAEIALDPAFWQALGKVLQWQMTKTATAGVHVRMFWFFDNEWQAKAHEFYDLILTGTDTKAFWEELLK